MEEGCRIVFALLVAIVCFSFPIRGWNSFGGIVRENTVLPLAESPYEVRTDIIVESTLEIKPGVELRFAPGIGITVKQNGVLIAKGEPDKQIVFTKLLPQQQHSYQWSDSEDVTPGWPEVRLVDGTSILEGRLQMLYKGKWRTICTNSKNWTAPDMHVMCKQLGFSGGLLYRWFPRNNDSSQMLYESPGCTGNETALSECPKWDSRQVGSGVCDFHEDIGILCDGNIGDQISYNWRGLKFDDAKAVSVTPIVNKVNQIKSLSVLEYVGILYAGVDAMKNVTAAINVTGMPPQIRSISVKYSAFDGVYLYKPLDSYNLEDSIIAENRGTGIFVNSSISTITVSGSVVRDNGGNGIYYTYHESFLPDLPFCDTGNIKSAQTYPLRRSLVQLREQYMRPCEQEFEVASWTGQVLTVNFLGFVSDAEDMHQAGRIEVYDGHSINSRRLARVFVLNDTYPQSVTSTKQNIMLRYIPAKQRYVTFTVEILANIGKAYDLNITNCAVASNNGKGITINNQRSGILVNRTYLTDNSHAAGLDVSGGCGDVIVNDSSVTSNLGDGVNITSAGGYMHIDLTSIGNNTGRGISFWFNETSNSKAVNHTFHVTRSEIVHNSLHGMLIGNICRSDSIWNISLNSFHNNQDTAILFSTCWGIDPGGRNKSTILVTHNQFEESEHLAIHFAPVLYSHLLIEHNKFISHKRGVLFINSLNCDDFIDAPANVEVQFNHFTLNTGTFVVNIGMIEGSSNQTLLFTKNHLEHNFVSEPFESLNPRSRVAAVVVVSSSNTDIYRNLFANDYLLYQLGSHLEKHNVVINATYNYWGQTNMLPKKVYEHIFDRKDRYNLAEIEFLPFLLFPSDLDSTTSISDKNERDKLILFQSGSNIGGEISGFEVLRPGEYTVKRDIYVHSTGKLEVQPGVTLKFDQSVGVMVQGTLISEASSESNPIIYTRLKGPQTSVSAYKVRLSNVTEGRLEVLMNGRWGSVCSYGWDIIDAAVACHQMGLVLHPEDWHLEQSEFLHSSKPHFVISNLQCNLLNTDITLCKAETDFENSCMTEVGLKCHHPSWSGLRLGMSAEESRLRYVIVEHAGLFDYSTNSFKPALQVDFNKHILENLIIRQNSDSGIGIMWNEMFLPGSRQIINSNIFGNKRHGLILHAQGINVVQCTIEDNVGSGVHYNPMFSRMEQQDLMTWVNLQIRSNVIVIPDDVQETVYINPGERRYLIFSKQQKTFDFTLKTSVGRSLGIMVLNPFSEASTEKMIIYGFLKSEIYDTEINAPWWDLRQNLTSFPLKTRGYGVSAEYDSGRNPSGQGILYITSVDNQRNRLDEKTHPTIHLKSATIQRCGRGFSSHHYNRDISVHKDHFHRYSNETILITNTTITNSKQEAVFVWAPFWDQVIKDLAEVNYTILHSEIKDNARSLLHYSRDIRNSNNIFHWTINHTVFSNNANGGIDVRLPYVWQYTENYTHSFSMHNSTLSHNHNFEFSIDGHFARLNMSYNTFQNNYCKKGVISVSGMEKEMLIEENTITNNSGQFAVSFNIMSHTEKFGVISATFHKNIIMKNRDTTISLGYNTYQPTSYAVAIRGVQPINITRNLFENPNLQFELLAGLLTGSIDNIINVGKNWWGANNITIIRQRIFDFDDWNGYVIADFNPFLGVPLTDGGLLPVDVKEEPFKTDNMLSGRVFQNIRLSRRNMPYVVSSDLTIMPDVIFSIDPGVILEFHPSIGILALGDIIAEGTAEEPIIMRPIKMVDDRRFRRNTSYPKSRLCINEKCDVRSHDGFLETYNVTTEQWVPVCDGRFTERNAQVVCNELGLSTLNVHVKSGLRLDIGPTEVGRIRSWPHPLECVGNENRLSDCEYRLNGYVDNYQCKHTDNFIYIYCGPDVLQTGVQDHWGGIRFSISSFEGHVISRPTLNYIAIPSSKLRHVHITGAGVLHGEKSAAIQVVLREVQFDYVNITECASHGIETIAVPGNLTFDELIVKNNIGSGLSLLSLTGESSYGTKLAYDPLLDLDMSYGIFGMMDMCDTNKEVLVEDRILLYYKYDNQPVDCVKIFSSLYYVKQIGFRLLQFNLFNGTNFSAQPDYIKIFDGDIFNTSTPELGTISWKLNSDASTKYYVSSESTLSIQLHTIGGSGAKGFIAEVITLPISHPGARNILHTISYSEITDNGQEGIAYRSAGEITHSLSIHHNRIANNGQELFGNFTVSNSAVLLDIQNAQKLYFYNNLIMDNQGGLSLRVDSQTSFSALQGMISNNLFTKNNNREALKVFSKKSGTFQFVSIYKNYFARNYAQYRDTILFSQVISNMTENIAYNNTGKHFLDVQGFERLPLSHQTCQRNWFWKNAATDDIDRSTIVASNSGQHFNYNYLVNPDNDFELAAQNRSLETSYTRSELREAPIDATNNWWGFNGTAAIAGRIKDYFDYEELLEVKYVPFLPDNSSVLSGKCAGGWKKIGDTCFTYIGGMMTFDEAKSFCEMENASMPYVKTKHTELTAFVEEQQVFYNRYYDRVWIQSNYIPFRECAVLINRKVVTRPCDEYFPFLCERDPEITVRLWIMDTLTIAFVSVTVIAFVFVMLCLSFWFCKSRQRYREKLERRNSIRASIRSNRSLTGFSELGYKRRLESAYKVEETSKGPELRFNGSVDSIEKTPSKFSCSMDDSYENTVADTSTSRVQNNGYSDFVNRFCGDAQLENTAADVMARPTFDLTYENQGFVDRSMSRNSHEMSRDWSSTTDSTLDMKRSLDNVGKEVVYHNDSYRHTPSPHLISSQDSNSRDGASSCSSTKRPPLETAM